MRRLGRRSVAADGPPRSRTRVTPFRNSDITWSRLGSGGRWLFRARAVDEVADRVGQRLGKTQGWGSVGKDGGLVKTWRPHLDPSEGWGF